MCPVLELLQRGGSDGPGAHSRRDPTDAVRGIARSAGDGRVEPGGGSGVARDERAVVSSLAGSFGGRGAARVGGTAGWGALWRPRAGGREPAGSWALYGG